MPSMPKNEILIPTSYTARFKELLEVRGFTTPEEISLFLYPHLKNLFDPLLLKGVREACFLLREALVKKEKVFIHGDYDVDGITGSAIMSRTLTVLGVEHEVFLPHRAEDGYGVSSQAIIEAAERGFKILMTVDCGVTAKEQLDLAKSKGMLTIVIDHHKIPETGLPDANAMINPFQEECHYPFDELSAGGLAFKLSQALLGERAYAYLDLAAVSTVCDVAPIKSENRILVAMGLKLLSKGTSLGFSAIAEVAKLKQQMINVGHIGFTFGPRINAAGRMSSPLMALRLLLSDNPRETLSLATALDEENKARQKEEKQLIKEAIADVERTMNFNQDRVIVVGKEGWHQGIIGIVAARLVEKFHRPAIVIAIEKGIGKGSGRSIKNFDLYQAMKSCEDLFQKFGGHPQAAGLSMDATKIDALRKKINDYARETTHADDYIKKQNSDLEITLSEINEPFLRELELLEPHGMGNPRPVFYSRELTIKTTPLKYGPQSLSFHVMDQHHTYDVNWYIRDAETMRERSSDLKKGLVINLYYHIKQKTWQGADRISLDAKDFEEVSST